MRVIIGICSSQFCMMTADAAVDAAGQTVSGVRRLNKSILYSCAGLPEGEQVEGLSGGQKKLGALTLRSAYKLAVKDAYARLEQKNGEGICAYMLAGRDTGGKFRIYTVRADLETGELTRKDEDTGSKQIYISLVLPPEIAHMERGTMSRIQGAIGASGSVRQLEKKLEDIIHWLALQDPAIGGKVETLVCE